MHRLLIKRITTTHIQPCYNGTLLRCAFVLPEDYVNNSKTMHYTEQLLKHESSVRVFFIEFCGMVQYNYYTLLSMVLTMIITLY